MHGTAGCGAALFDRCVFDALTGDEFLIALRLTKMQMGRYEGVQ